MSVQELINELEKVLDKNINARVWDDEFGDSNDIVRIEVYENEIIII